MQTECPHRRFCRLDAVRDELSPQAAERFDQLDRLRCEGDRPEGDRLLPGDALPLEAAPARAGRVRALTNRCRRRARAGQIRALLQRLPHQALGQRTPMQAYNENFNQSALAA